MTLLRRKPRRIPEPLVAETRLPVAFRCSFSVREGYRNYPSSVIVFVLFSFSCYVLYFYRSKLHTQSMNNTARAQTPNPDRVTASHVEEAITALRLAEDEPLELLSAEHEKLLVCIPTVTRRFNTEYISNAIKSWRVATRNLSSMGRIAVFEMDTDENVRIAHSATWFSNVFSKQHSKIQNISWLQVLYRNSENVREPRKQTHGDSEGRVRWRSKEALDYAEVLERCIEMADGEYVAIVQDDVLFTPDVSSVVNWLDTHMASSQQELSEKYPPEQNHGDRQPQIWCSASLFDVISETGSDKISVPHTPLPQRSSNMVAKVYAVRQSGKAISRWIKFIRRRFDESPIDWLFDEYCRQRGHAVYVMHPNPVRHRGAISSLAENHRDGVLT